MKKLISIIPSLILLSGCAAYIEPSGYYTPSIIAEPFPFFYPNPYYRRWYYPSFHGYPSRYIHEPHGIILRPIDGLPPRIPPNMA